MEVTPGMIYNNYCNIMYPHLNRIFGEGNWCLNTLTDQAIIYSGYFNIQLPSCFIFKLNNDNVYIEFKESPTFQEFLDKNPKLDKNKPIYIHIDINNKKFIINATLSDKKFQEIYPEITVSLNNITVRKIHCIICNITNRIFCSIKSKDLKTFNFLTTMHVVFREILSKITINKGMKEENKQKLQNQIAKIDEIYNKNIYMSNSDIDVFKKSLSVGISVEASGGASSGAPGASSEAPNASEASAEAPNTSEASGGASNTSEASAEAPETSETSTELFDIAMKEMLATHTLATLATQITDDEPPAKKAK